MKKTKAILVALCAVLLIAASVMGTLAWLTDESETVTNTFTVGKVDITLDEAKVDASGAAIAGEARVKTNAYKLIPGHTYTKDPTVHVANDSEDCYLFVVIENGIVDFETMTAADQISAQMGVKGWKLVTDTTNVYAWCENNAPKKATKGDNAEVFEYFIIDSDVTGGALEEAAGANANPKAEITVTAYAVQADGFEGKTAEQIWSATFGATSGT